MKLYFKNADELKEGILLLEEELSMTACFESCDDADCTVTVEKADEPIVSVSLNGKSATITYGGGAVRFFRGLGYIASWIEQGISEKSVSEKPLFETNGGMFDVSSHGAVLRVETIQATMRKMALMGLNTFMLYTEDTYEVENWPYFGHLRGRYTKDELKAMDAYALKLGIEMVPCIQLLGHLRRVLHWGAHGCIRDTADCLLVGAEETYQFIDDLLKTISECFTSRKLHMGLDETHSLGTGAYRKRFGDRPHMDIFYEHLHRIVPMVQSYGFKPMMWSDMFFKSPDPSSGDYSLDVQLPENIRELLPEGVTQVYWDYYHTDKNFYITNLKRHKQISDHTIFAGGIWCWHSYMMTHARTLRYTVPALESCKEAGAKDIFATIWHHGIGCIVNSLVGLAVYSEFDYKGYYNEDEVRESLVRTCHTNYDNFLTIEQLEYGHGDDNLHGISQLLVFNDPLQGWFDRHLTIYDLKGHYTKVYEDICNMDFGNDMFTPSFELAKALGDVLQYKADFGLRLKEAYDAKDMDALRNLIDVCDTLLEKLTALREVHYNTWMYNYKVSTWKVLDHRYGGIIQRFVSAKRMITDFVNGKIDHIDEVDAPRLWFDTPDRASRNPDEPDLNVLEYATMNKIELQ